MKILICGLDELQHCQGKVTHLLSIIDPEDEEFLLTLRIPPKRRLALYCHDVASYGEAEARERELPGSRCVAPSKAMIETALNFTKNIKKSATLLINCGQGISRSTALAFGVVCQDQPTVSERAAWEEIIKIRPQASPNRLIVKHADELLKRKGRMTAAVQTHRKY